MPSAAKEKVTQKHWTNGLTSIHRISRQDIPERQYHHRSALNDLVVMRELNTALATCEKEGINPQEIAGEIDLNTPDIQKVSEGRKRFFQSLRGAIKHCIAEHRLNEKVDVVVRGNRLFVVGRSEIS